MNWSKVRITAEVAVSLWFWRNLSLERRAEVCASHIYSILRYRLSVRSLPHAILMELVMVLLSLLFCREVCYLHHLGWDSSTYTSNRFPRPNMFAIGWWRRILGGRRPQKLSIPEKYALGLSDGQVLFRKALCHVLVRWTVQDNLIDDFDLTKQEDRSLWPCTPGLKYLTNDEESLSLWRALWLGNCLFLLVLKKSPNCNRCSE